MWEMIQNKRLIFGCGKVRETADILDLLNVKKVFIIVYDSNAPILAKIKNNISLKGINYAIYDKVRLEPDLFVIDEGATILQNEKCDGILAIGGGSVIDAAKAIAMLVTNGGSIEEYQMQGKPILNETLPLMVIPTTSGTGSEATKVSVISNNHNGLKKSIYSPYMIPDIVVLDPEVTFSLPAGLTASTGIDALSHAIESYVSLNANQYTEMFSLNAIELINTSLIRAVQHGDDVKARSNMMLASYMAGCAINAGIGIAHIIAQPLGGMLKIPHGEACSIFLPLSMEYNLEYSMKKYRVIAEKLGVSSKDDNDIIIAKQGIEKVKNIIMQVGTDCNISKYIKDYEFNIEQITETVYSSTGHIKCNPRPVDSILLKEIIGKAI